MIKKVLDNLKYSFSLFRLPRRELVFWIAIRAFTSAISPLMIPAIVWFMIDAMEQQDMSLIVVRAVVLLVVLIPCFGLSYYIYVYSDAWVMKSMYKFQEVCIDNLIDIDLSERRERYMDGKVSNLLNQSAWSLIQIWLHIFRIMAPAISIIVLVILEIKVHYLIVGISLVSVISDYILLKVQSKRNYTYNGQLIEIEGEKEQSLKELVYDISFYSTHLYEKEKLEEVVGIRRRYWKLNRKKGYVNYVCDAANQVLNGVFSLGIWTCLSNYSNEIGTGEVATSNTIFENLRTEVGLFRKQMVSIVDKYTPIEKQRSLLELEKSAFETDQELKPVCEGNKIAVLLSGKEIIRDISFQIRFGDRIAIVGENGAGKSTLLKCICGLLKPNEGKVVYQAAKDITVDYVPADNYDFSQSVFDNTVMAKTADDTEYAFDCLERAQLLKDYQKEELKEKNAKELSGGEAQRMSIARAFYGNRKILFLDEATSALDRETAHSIFDSVLKTRDTVLFTTHNVEEIEYATRIWLMKAGRLVLDCTLKEFKQDEKYRTWVGEE